MPSLYQMAVAASIRRAVRRRAAGWRGPALLRQGFGGHPASGGGGAYPAKRASAKQDGAVGENRTHDLSLTNGLLVQQGVPTFSQLHQWLIPFKGLVVKP